MTSSIAHTVKWRKNIWKTNFEAVSNKLSTISWPIGRETEHFWSFFRDSVINTVDMFTPVSSQNVSYRKPWFNILLHNLHNLKCLIWRRYKRTKRDQDFIEHRQVSNRLTCKIRKACEEYESNLLSMDQKVFYSYVRSNIDSRVTIPVVKDISGSVCQDHVAVSELFAEEFSKAYSGTFDDSARFTAEYSCGTLT